MDDALCLPEIVSGGETVVSCMKPVGIWAGRGDRALAQSGSSHVTLSITLVMTAGHRSSSWRQKPAGSGRVGVVWSNQTSLGGLTANHHLYTAKGRLMSAVSVLEGSLSPGESTPPASASS